MNVFITLNFQIAACFRSQHAEVSICQRVARGAFENYATRLARDKRLPPSPCFSATPPLHHSWTATDSAPVRDVIIIVEAATAAHRGQRHRFGQQQIHLDTENLAESKA